MMLVIDKVVLLLWVYVEPLSFLWDDCYGKVNLGCQA